VNEALFEEEELGAMMKNDDDDLSFFLFFLCVKRRLFLRVDQCFVSSAVFFFSVF